MYELKVRVWNKLPRFFYDNSLAWLFEQKTLAENSIGHLPNDKKSDILAIEAKLAILSEGGGNYNKSA